MLKFSTVLKSTPFELTDESDQPIILKATEFTVGDVNKLVKIQRPVVENETMSIDDKSELLSISRVIASVKREDGSYFWETVDEFKAKNYPTRFLTELSEEVYKLNPVNNDTLAQKKRKP